MFRAQIDRTVNFVTHEEFRGEDGLANTAGYNWHVHDCAYLSNQFFEKVGNTAWLCKRESYAKTEKYFV